MWWIVVDPISGDEPKFVQAASKDGALRAAGEEWSYPGDEEVMAEFLSEAMAVALTHEQARELKLSERE